MVGFGKNSEEKDICKTQSSKLDVREAAASKYALHIDGFFRIMIILAKDDMFRPNSKLQKDGFDEDDFEWDVEGNNKFDEQKKELCDVDLLVREIAINEIGDLKIVLSDDFCIEVFIDTNEDEECWRFFEVGNSEKSHFVVIGGGYYEQ